MSTDSQFLRDINAQPDAMKDLINFYRTSAGKSLLEQWVLKAKAAKRVVFCGMGTSEFAAELILTDLARQGVDASTADAGELLHYPKPINCLLTLVSQSGESVETRKIMERCEPGQDVVAITNNDKSTIACTASLNLPMFAGIEATVSAKTYVNTMGVLFLMAQAFGGSAAVDKALDRLTKLADKMLQFDKEEIDRAATLVSNAGAIHFVGRGPTMAAVKQATLTMQEGARLPAAGFTGAAFRHGPFETVGPNHHAVFFIPGGVTCQLLTNVACDVLEKGSRAIVITDQDLDLPKMATCCVLKVPEWGEDLFAISAATIQELLLHEIARQRGIQTGIFRYGTKVTLVE
jgi:glucosamine--fructose-6-phosphate aminotransferase (isomerizing)